MCLGSPEQSIQGPGPLVASGRGLRASSGQGGKWLSSEYSFVSFQLYTTVPQVALPLTKRKVNGSTVGREFAFQWLTQVQSHDLSSMAKTLTPDASE